ncbi:MAG: CusA/CzcA family heavy metal efflux RND transporter [Muribaculaceae bacterium]|nr:CusA/CzcA family heavy metal efflux RND transporter [Muribaculaceae bacterium]
MKKDIMLTVIRKRWVMLCLFLLLGLFGYFSWKSLSIEAYPDIADVTSQIVTQVPGLAAEEVEQQITIPLERAINGLPGMHVMRSKSTFGLSMITIVFRDGTEDYWSRQRVQERLAEVELPYGAVPGLDPMTSPVGEIYRYIIESDNHSLRELTDLQNWVIMPRIKQVPGVADVTNFGGITTQFQIEIDPSRLEQYNLSLGQVTEAIENNNANVGGSMLQRGDLGYVIRGIGLIENLQDLGNIVVSSEAGVPIFLKDLGSLEYGNLERKGVLGYTDRSRNYSESLEGIVLLLKHENPSKVLDGIHQAVEELNNGGLPEGVHIHTFLDRTNLVNTTLNTVSHTLLAGMALVILVLILFLGNWRGALLVSVTIPVALLIAFILMRITDIPANLLSLGAIDFGIIVDGAIVMLDTVLKKREDHQDEYLSEGTIAQRVKEVGRPILFSTIVIITAYLPLFAFERVERKLFTPMAFSMSYAMFGALLVALLLIPGIAYAIYRKPRKIYKNRWLEKLKAKYIKGLLRLMEKPGKVIIPSVGILIAGIGLSIMVGKDFLPELDEGSIWLQVSLPPGISVQKSKELSDTLRAHTMKYPEVTYVMVQAGRNDDGTDPFTPSHFEVSIGIKPYSEWPAGKKKSDLIDELAAEYATLPGFNVGFSQPMIDGVMDKIAGAHSELVVKVYGEDFPETRRIANDIIKVLETVPGSADLDIDQEPPSPQLRIIMNRDAIARYGLNVSDVAELIEVAIGGKAIAQLYQGDRQYDITCKYKENARNTPEKIAGLMLTSSTGAKIPLSQVADIKLTMGESTITREMNRRHLTVKLNLRGRDLSSFLNEAQKAINEKVVYEKDKYIIKWGGAFENQNRAYSRLAVILPLTLACMFILLFLTFGKFRRAALVLSIVPLALFGGMLALYLRGMTLNVSSAVGFIAMFGLSIQNGIIMVSQINGLRKKGTELFKAVIEGARQRFRPILMTSTTTIIGLLPASIATGIGSDVQRPLATVIVYGLIFSTLLSMFILPVLYYLIEKKFSKDSENEK